MSTVSAPSFVDPSQALAHLPILTGQSAVDFGCGAGYFSFEFAKRVGPEGHVTSLSKRR